MESEAVSLKNRLEEAQQEVLVSQATITGLVAVKE